MSFYHLPKISGLSRGARLDSSYNKKLVRNSRNLYGNGKRISIRNVPTGKTGLPFQNFHLSREFSSGTNQKFVYHLHPNKNFREFVVNGKQPIFARKSAINRLFSTRSPLASKGKVTKPDQDGGRRSTCYRISFTLTLKAMSIHKVWWSRVFPPARQIFLLGNALYRQFLYPRCNITSASPRIARCLSSFRGASFQDVSILLYIKISFLWGLVKVRLFLYILILLLCIDFVIFAHHVPLGSWGNYEKDCLYSGVVSVKRRLWTFVFTTQMSTRQQVIP